MAKLMVLAVFAVVLALGSAASFGGYKDVAGNYYDLTTGQYSSALTGKVYNTAPVVAAPVAPYAYSSSYAVPYYGYPYAGVSPYVAPYAAPYYWK